MKLPILNRDFQHPADGWYQIEVPGEHLNRESGVVQVVDDAAVCSIVNRFNQEAEAYTAKFGAPFPGMLIDHEHFKHQADKETVAYGWLMRLQNRHGQPFGQIRWTNTGKPAIDGGDYRFFSSEYDPKDLQILNRGEKPLRVRPLRLDGLTLTNDPNNKGGAPITNRNGGPSTIIFAGAGAPAVNERETKQAKMNNIAMKLGLVAEASEEAILAEVTRLITLKNRNTILEAENQALLGEQVDVLLAAHGVTDEKVINRLKPVLTGLHSREERVTTLTDFGFRTGESGKTGPGQNRLNNRDTRPPQSGRQSAVTGTRSDHAQATKIMNHAHQIKKDLPNITDATAVLMAQKEVEAGT